jgi:uncharacterized protein YbjQ (UPF0145 family)
VLGDIEVTVRKANLFEENPSRAKVNEAMQEEAADLCADAVVQVRYGSVGIGMMSWGQMEGKGRAVKY